MIIIFEGLDGAGKTTIINQLAQRLDNAVVLRFPNRNDTTTGKEISEILNHKQNTYSKHRLSTLCLEQIYESIDYILEVSNSNRIVLIDRFILSNYVYQMDPNLSTQYITNLYQKLNNLTKVITIFIDIDAQTSIQRTSSKTPEIFDSIEFQQNIYNLYKLTLKGLPSTVLYSGYDPSETTLEKIYNNIKTMFIL